MWDLRTGSIHDAYGYENPITSMMFDARRIVAAAGEPVVRVYDKMDGRQWACGPGVPTDDDDEEGFHQMEKPSIANIEKIRIKDGYLVEGRRDGTVGVWSC
jgi:mitochondrial division protein 1